jgi:hypothetical protein
MQATMSSNLADNPSAAYELATHLEKLRKLAAFKLREIALEDLLQAAMLLRKTRRTYHVLPKWLLDRSMSTASMCLSMSPGPSRSILGQC